MKVLLLDDEELALKSLKYVCEQTIENAQIVTFTEGEKALNYLQKNRVDVVFADIEMPEMNGMEFMRRAQVIRPGTNVIFTTAYTEYALEAMQLHASGYLTKPVRADDIRRELNHLRYDLSTNDKHLKARCFGKFEVYCDGEMLSFSRSAEKEILAYLIDQKGGGVNYDEMAMILWEDSELRSKRRDYLRVLFNGLRKTLSSVGCEDALIKQTNYFAIDPEKIQCDYFDFLKGDEKARASYHGEYMLQYEWGFMTTADLDEIIMPSI